MDKVSEILERGVAQILPNKKGLASLMRKRKIMLYQGFDPSSPNLHIGNWIGIRKLAQFQKLGHKVIFLIGDFTGMIGDPTDKSAARKKLTREEVLANAKDYKKQISRTLRFDGPNPAEIRFNSHWLSKLTFDEVVELASNFTVQQMIERDFFQERLKTNKPIYFHEFFYPLMQGYDSLAMNVDLEIGGNDQLFNMMAGRSLMKAVKAKEKYVLTLKLLADPTGKKMGKSEGNTINLTDKPTDMFGKIMAQPDSLLRIGFELLTNIPLDQISNMHPMEAKKLLAFDIVSQLFDSNQAQISQREFEKVFQKKDIPDKPEQLTVKENEIALLDLVFETKKIKSRSETKRLIKEGAVEIDNKSIKDPGHIVNISKDGLLLKIGKKSFFKIKMR